MGAISSVADGGSETSTILGVSAIRGSGSTWRYAGQRLEWGQNGFQPAEFFQVSDGRDRFSRSTRDVDLNCPKSVEPVEAFVEFVYSLLISLG
jgi:hypothetical protein